ncbi:MAG: hypothetical protein QOJ39_3234 [Candidatus Eremiobacteraeota bacterium]|jgi:uncharacterized protein YkwD|nr:hypothetical protein [Candidatus Eremiobacteraeota bacterium]MEA2721370.1 hypothetical protein [Candidatus Eremiobacteraeota bacterium]
MTHTAQPAPLVSASREVESTVTVALVNVHRPVSVESAALALANDVNRERVSRNLAPLTRDAELDKFAAAKAMDMASRGYFGHTSPDGVTFANRMRAVNWPTQYVGENIAFDVDEPAAHRAFVNSPPHFSNVIDPNERRIGVAVVNVGTHQTFYVEDFSQ